MRISIKYLEKYCYYKHVHDEDGEEIWLLIKTSLEPNLIEEVEDDS